MFELLDVLDAFSTPLKIGWVAWMAWGVAQVFWYRHERRPQAAARGVSLPARKAVPVKKAAPAPAPVVTRLITPEPVLASAPAPVREVPVFDPSKAVVESFTATTNDLDTFVSGLDKNRGFGTQAPHSM